MFSSRFLSFQSTYLEEQEQQNSLQTEKFAKAEIWTSWKVNKFQSVFLFIFALSFYRSQNVLCWSKCFVLDQKSIYILCQSQTFCARQIDDLHSDLCDVTKVFEDALYAVKFFGLAQKVWNAKKKLGLVKGQGIVWFTVIIITHCSWIPRRLIISTLCLFHF